MECTIRVEACDNYKRTKWHCSRTRYLDEPPLVGLEDFANHAGGDSPLTGEEKNHVIDAMTVADSKDPIRSPKAFIGGLLGNIAIGQEDGGAVRPQLESDKPRHIGCYATITFAGQDTRICLSLWGIIFHQENPCSISGHEPGSGRHDWH